MKFSNSSILVFFVFIIYPLGALPLIIIEIYNKKNYAFNYLAVFMGLFAYLWIPSGDLSRIQEDFDIIKTKEFLDLFSVISLDYMYNVILYIFGRLNLDFAFVRFSICIISYLFYFEIIKKIILKNKNISSSRLISFLVFLIIFFLMRFAGYLTGVRFTLATSLFLYGFFNVIYNSNKNGWYYVISACLVHFSFWIPFLVMLFNKLLKFSFSRLSGFLLISSSLFLSTYLISYIIGILPINDLLKAYLENYTIGFFASEEYELRSLLFRISKFFSTFIIYPATIFVFLTNRGMSKYKIFIMFTIILSLMYNMNSAYARYAFISIFVFTITFLVHYNKTNINMFFLLLLCSFITYSNSVYVNKRELSAGMQYKILYSPLPVILSSEYDKKWIGDNISKNGSMTKFQK